MKKFLGQISGIKIDEIWCLIPFSSTNTNSSFT
jgi:hypothetical protein